MFFYRLYIKIRIKKDTNIYNKELFLQFIKEMKQNEKKDNEEMEFLMNEYDNYLTRKKERIEEEEKEETKQQREIEKLEAELKYKEKLMHVQIIYYLILF